MIYYEPGARGDFLANAISDGTEVINNKCEVGPELGQVYSKVHKYPWGPGWQYYIGEKASTNLLKSMNAVFAQAKESGAYTIRIASCNISDCIDIASFHHQKNKDLVKEKMSDITLNSALGVAWRDSIDLRERHRYDLVINFSDLFDIGYLKKLYFEINNKHMSDEHCGILVANIEKQVRFSQTEHVQQLLNEVEQCKKTHKYMSCVDLYHIDIQDTFSLEKKKYGIFGQGRRSL
jgi:hypothetical protein